MPKRIRRTPRSVAVGCGLIGLGLLLNPWWLAARFSPDGLLSLSSRLLIWSVEVICIGVGILVLRGIRLNPTQLSRTHQTLALVWLNACLLFAAVNLLAYVVLVVQGSGGGQTNPVSAKYGFSLEPIYPGWDGKALNQLLRETWSRPYRYAPYTQFTERPSRGTYVNVHEAGFRFVKPQGPWPPDPDALNIFLFGGSTAFGYGVSDDQTIASCLQERLSESSRGRRVAVYNFGRGHYFSTQERLLYEQLVVGGAVPDIAIFLDGLNDFYRHGVRDEPVFTEQLRRFFDGQTPSPVLGLPVFRLLGWRTVRSESEDPDPEERYRDPERLSGVIRRYLRNKQLIEAVSERFHVQPFFVWQPVPTYKYDLHLTPFFPHGLGAYRYSFYGYPLMAEHVARGELGENFLWLADMQEGARRLLYVDKAHYSAEMSRAIAGRIAEFLLERGWARK